VRRSAERGDEPRSFLLHSGLGRRRPDWSRPVGDNENVEPKARSYTVDLLAHRACIAIDVDFSGGGANRSNAPRLAFTNQYCEPWARPQENFYLGVPKRAMSREMQILLGYELRRPGDIMGQVGGYHPIKTLDPDFVLRVLR
jgi:hypothetical protein